MLEVWATCRSTPVFFVRAVKLFLWYTWFSFPKCIHLRITFCPSCRYSEDFKVIVFLILGKVISSPWNIYSLLCKKSVFTVTDLRQWLELLQNVWFKWGKVFKNGPRKACWRQPLKCFKGCLSRILFEPFFDNLFQM